MSLTCVVSDVASGELAHLFLSHLVLCPLVKALEELLCNDQQARDERVEGRGLLRMSAHYKLVDNKREEHMVEEGVSHARGMQRALTHLPLQLRKHNAPFRDHGTHGMPSCACCRALSRSPRAAAEGVALTCRHTLQARWWGLGTISLAETWLAQ
jgi:hypothetical protein